MSNQQWHDDQVAGDLIMRHLEESERLEWASLMAERDKYHRAGTGPREARGPARVFPLYLHARA